MDAVIAAYDFSGLAPRRVGLAQQTCARFEHWVSLGAAADGGGGSAWQHLLLDGAAVGDAQHTYSLRPSRGGIDVQVLPSRGGDPRNFLVGVHLFREDGRLRILPYCNPHLD